MKLIYNKFPIVGSKFVFKHPWFREEEKFDRDRVCTITSRVVSSPITARSPYSFWTWDEAEDKKPVVRCRIRYKYDVWATIRAHGRSLDVREVEFL